MSSYNRMSKSQQRYIYGIGHCAAHMCYYLCISEASNQPAWGFTLLQEEITKLYLGTEVLQAAG